MDKQMIAPFVLLIALMVYWVSRIHEQMGLELVLLFALVITSYWLGKTHNKIIKGEKPHG